MKNTYIDTLKKLDKKLKKIKRKIKFWFSDWYVWDFNKINSYMAWYWLKTQILPSEIEYLTFEYLPFTFDGEERYEIVLKADDKNNLLSYNQ